MGVQKDLPDSLSFLDAVKALELKHRVRFAFDHELLAHRQVIGWNGQEDLNTILDQMVAPLGFEYERSNNTILIIPVRENVRENITLNGVIVDESTGEALPNATVYLTGSGKYTVTNREGRFSFLDVPADTSIIEVRYLGYTPHKFMSRQLEENDDVQINLSNEPSVLEEILVSDKKENIFEVNAQASKTSVDIEEFKTMANYGEPDVFRSVQLLPGISATNETSSGLQIRGGAPEQNLVLFDGFTVYHLDHFFGIFSAFNSHVIKDVQLFKGGYGAEYGTRVSGVMDITGKSGNTHKPSGNIGVNLINSNAVLELPITKKMSLLVAGRRAYTDIIQSSLYRKLFNHVRVNDPSLISSQGETDEIDEIEPKFYFYDVNTKLSYKINNNNLLNFSYYDGKDNLSLKDSDDFFLREVFDDGNFFEQNERRNYDEKSNWGNRGAAFRYGRQWNKKFFSELKIVGSKFFRKQDLNQFSAFSYSFSYDSVAFNPNDSSEFLVRDTVSASDTFAYSFASDNLVKENSVTLSGEYKISDRNLLRLGLFNIRNHIKYRNLEDGSNTDNLDINERGNVTGIYVQNTLDFNNHRSGLTAGMRLSRYSQNSKYYVEPRISVHHQVSDHINLKAALGRYYQFAVNTSINDPTGTQTSFWLLADDEGIPILKSNHYILGLTYSKQGFVLDVEGYFRNVDGLNNFTLNPFVDDDTQTFFTGNGRGFGLELLAKKQFRNFHTWVAYTLSKTEDRFAGINNGNYFASDQDQRHELKWVNQLTLGKFDLSAVWVYGSGRPFSPTDSVTFSSNNDGIDFALPGVNLLTKNSLRLPAYHRLDLSAAYNTSLGKSKLSFGVNIVNVYGRRNIRGYRYGFGFDPTRGEFISRKEILLLGFTPSIFLNISF